MREFREIDPSGGLAAHIVESFRERVPRTLAAMGDAAAVPDPAELGRLAHSLGGMAGNVGATELAGLCARVEELVRSEALSRVERLLDDLAQAYERTCVALDEVSPTRYFITVGNRWNERREGESVGWRVDPPFR